MNASHSVNDMHHDDTASSGAAEPTAAAKTWPDCGVPRQIVEHLQRSDIHHPYPSQVKMLTAFLVENSILVVTAPHGIGKTTAIEIVAATIASRSIRRTIYLRPRQINPRILIMAPTQGSAEQVMLGLRALINAVGLAVHVEGCWGGSPFPDYSQAARTKIVVGTPGRVSGMIAHGNLSLDATMCVIWLECQELFGPDLRETDAAILNIMTRVAALDERCRSIIVSSRLEQSLLQQLTSRLLRHQAGDIVHLKWNIYPNASLFADLKFVNVNNVERDFAGMEDLIAPHKKNDLRYRAGVLTALWLKHFHRQNSMAGFTMIVCSTRHACERLYHDLTALWRQDGPYTAAERKFTKPVVLHGGMDEDHQADIRQSFNRGERLTLLTTHHSGCVGMKWACNPTVVCYDQPRLTQNTRLHDWLAKAARRGRPGRRPLCLTLLDPADDADWQLLTDIVEHLEELNQDVPDSLAEMLQARTT